MFYFSPRFTGVTLILIHLKGYFSPIESHECRSKIIKTDTLYVDCVEKNLESIPTDIDKNLAILNISKNPTLNELEENHLNTYDDLIELTMKELNITKISPNFFSPIPTLKILDISSTCFSDEIPKLPASMENIIANSQYKRCSKVSLPAMRDLEHLIVFESRENNLDDLPSLPINAPIQFIDLSKNPMKNLKYMDIAPLCILSQLKLFGTELSSKMYLQQCCGLQKWGEVHKITVFIKCDEHCADMKFDVKAIEAYNQCLNTPGSRFLTIDYIIFEILIFVIFLLSIGYLTYRYYTSDAVKEYKKQQQEQQQQQQEVVKNKSNQEEEFGEEHEEVVEELRTYEENQTQ